MVLAVVVSVTAAGCARTRNALPLELIPTAEVVGFPGVRGSWEQPEPIERSLQAAIQAADKDTDRLTDDRPSGYDVLCLSGGGAGGAFGAGLLCGWSESGTRPSFLLVTGVSSGALMAPFAFLGPEYDDVLRLFSAKVATRDILQPRPIVALAFGADSLAESLPLARLLEQCVDDRVVAGVAREHARGRRLFIGTTHLDAGLLMVWDMGAVAASGRPDAPGLFRKIMLASASIPIALPAQYFQVEADGRTYDEMHVDGGVVAEMFLYGVATDVQSLRRRAGARDRTAGRLYVIRNGYLQSPHQSTQPRLLAIAERAVYGFLDAKATSDAFRLHALAARDGLDFNLAYVPESFLIERKEPFDPQAMARMFALGHSLARSGYPWRKAPPGLDPRPAGPPSLGIPVASPPQTPRLELLSSQG